MKKHIKTILIIFVITILSQIVVFAHNQSNFPLLNNPKISFLASQQNSLKANGTKVVSNNDNKKQETNPDSIKKNSIKKIWESSDGFLNVAVELADEKSEIKLTVLNLLGKEIAKIYQGQPETKNDEGHFVFTSKTQLNLPKSIYVLILQGNTFKVADKFIITK
jgi:hypothetical protein